MTELRDIEESIRYSCRKNPPYGEELIKKIRYALQLQRKVYGMVEYLESEIKRSDVESYRQICRTELAMYNGILNSVSNEDKE